MSKQQLFCQIPRMLFLTSPFITAYILAMKLEKQLILIEKYPTLFKYYQNRVEPREPIFKGMQDIPEGWFSILENLFAEFYAFDPTLALTQVKSKWHILTVYFTTRTPEYDQIARNIISKYSKMSLKACDVCGEAFDSLGTGLRVHLLCMTRQENTSP